MPRQARARLRALATASCVASILALAACGDDGDGETTTPKPPPATVATGPESGPTNAEAAEARDRVNSALLDFLIDREGLPKRQAECAIDELESTVTDEDLQTALDEAAAGNGVPQDILDAAFEAGQSCADE